MIIKIIVLMSLCAVIAFRKHFKKRALFVFVLIVAICANIFIPAFEFFVRSEPQNDRILDYISQINWHDSDLLKSKGFDCDGETGTYADDDKFSIHVADATSYDKAEIVSEYKNIHYEYFSYLSDTLLIPQLRKSYSVIVNDKVVEINYKDCLSKPGIWISWKEYSVQLRNHITDNTALFKIIKQKLNHDDRKPAIAVIFFF